jgi:hypothetical protein
MTIIRNGTVEQTSPMSMGMAAGAHQTPNATYQVLEKLPSVVTDCSTHGVPANPTYGYQVTMTDAATFYNSGNFVHNAPWSVSDHGKPPTAIRLSFACPRRLWAAAAVAALGGTRRYRW